MSCIVANIFWYSKYFECSELRTWKNSKLWKGSSDFVYRDTQNLQGLGDCGDERNEMKPTACPILAANSDPPMTLKEFKLHRVYFVVSEEIERL